MQATVEELRTALSEVEGRQSISNQEAESRVAELNQKLEAAQNSERELTKQLDSVSAERDSLKANREESDSQSVNLQQTLDSTRSSLESAQAANEQMKSELSELTAAKDRADSQVQALQRSVQEKEEEIKGSKKQSKEALALLDDLTQEVANLKTACQEAADAKAGQYFYCALHWSGLLTRPI